MFLHSHQNPDTNSLVNKLLAVLVFIVLSNTPIYSRGYLEDYRPQYHLTPYQGWMGDPVGTIFYDNLYHLMWWGHATSYDLVYWNEHNYALQGGPAGFDYYSGSVVFDKTNSAGFNNGNDTAMVAVYTMHYSDGIEKVGISSSLNYLDFQYYSGNPVISTDQFDFRDPTVFWHTETSRWIMAITKTVDRNIEFYYSTDLKNWAFLSSFNTKGAKENIWEVPDLFQLPLNNDPNNKKWVLTCSMGPNRMQYWVGDFNGSTFTLDSLDNTNTGKHVTGNILQDFEGADFGTWTVSGSAFGTTPASGTLPGQQKVSGYIGQSCLNSFHGGDITTGKLISPAFTIEKPYINFLLGGGNGESVHIDLYVDGILKNITRADKNQETLRWKSWDVSGDLGKSATIEIVDDATGSWGHILVDHIVCSDVFYFTNLENANWVDWGKDYYAARSYRNFSSNPSDKTYWIGWMGNWDYAQDVPTSPWQGNQSIPRELELKYSDTKGYQLIQKPLQGLEKLRQGNFNFQNQQVTGEQEVTGFNQNSNIYELKVRFQIDSRNQIFGLNLADDGAGNKLVVGYDTKSSTLFVDRRNAGITNFNAAFPSIVYAPTPFPDDNTIDLHIFMDQSSVEVFANDYQTCLSDLVFTHAEDHKISLFSVDYPVTVLDFEAWEMKSIWDPRTYNVTLSVDMVSYSETEFNTVKVNGSFNDWGTPYELTNTSGSIWSVTVPMLEGQQDYRFEIDGPGGFQAEWPDKNAAGSCTNSLDMRIIDVTGDVVIPTVCWESCDACTAQVTLSIDMSTYSATEYNKVFVNGGFNGWGSAYELTNTAGKTWQVTVPMALGTQDFRFELDGPGGWTAEWPDFNATGDCFDYGNMRVLDVTGDIILSQVCWESCNACVTTFDDNLSVKKDLNVYINSANEIVISNIGEHATHITIYNIQGKRMMERSITGIDDSQVVICSYLHSGIYIIKVNNETFTYNKKFVIN